MFVKIGKFSLRRSGDRASTGWCKFLSKVDFKFALLQAIYSKEY